jgi:hypothetical protein
MSKFHGRRAIPFYIKGDIDGAKNGDILIYDEENEIWINADADLDGYERVRKEIRTETSNYVMVFDDSLILCDGTFTVTLPAAVEATGKIFRIKNIGTGIITVDGDETETIDDGLTAVMECQYEVITIISTGTEWFIV